MDVTYPVMLCVRVPRALHDALVEASHLERRTLSQLVRILLEDALKEKETDNDGTT